MSNGIKSTFFYLLIILLQAVLQGYLDFGPMVQFCLLPMVIIALPTTWRNYVTMLVAFAIGILADLFSGGIPGINAASAALVAATRDFVYRRFISTDNRSASSVPSIRSLGKVLFIKYISILSAEYCLLYIFLDSFSIVPFGYNILRFLVTYVISSTCIFIFSHFAPQE